MTATEPRAAGRTPATGSPAAAIPFLDLKAATAELRPALDAAVGRVLDRGVYILGPELAAFEAAWAAHTASTECVGLASGLSAIELALRAVGVRAGDEVIVPSNTYIATWLAVTAIGATLVPVEPDPATYVVDPDAVEARITGRTRAILPVHLYGHPADMGALVALGRRHGVPVVVDGAQAHGVGWQPWEAQPDATAWSFYPSKNLGALGDAGAVTTSRPDVAARLRSLRNYGGPGKNRHDEVGTNSRLDELQAAMLSVKLSRLDEWNDRRRRLAAVYRDHIDPRVVALPTVAPWARPVWHLYVVRSDRRDQLQTHLAAGGVTTLVHYPVAPHHQGAYCDTPIGRLRLPVSERLHREVLSLPLHPHLDESDARPVATAVNRFGA